MEQRWLQMDVARGLGILIIVLAHGWFVASSPQLLYPLLGAFILPLFFLVSGVFFRADQPFWPMALRRADALLKPYFVTLLLYVAVRAALRGQPLLPDVAGVLYASVATIPWQALWFLPCFWLVTLLAWPLLRLMQRLPASLRALLPLGLLLLGLWLLPRFWPLTLHVAGRSYALPGLPFSAELVPIGTAFFLLGSWLAEPLRRHRGSVVTLGAALLLFGAVFAQQRAGMDLAQRHYAHGLWTTVLALTGSYACWVLSGLLARRQALGRALGYVGQGTLILLIFHGEIQHKAFSLLQRLGLGAPAAALVAFVVAVALPLLLGEAMRRVRPLRMLYFPLPAGRQPAA